MNVLVVGGGGREHALAWKVSHSTQVQTVFIAPGNPGTAAEPKCQNINIAVDDFTALMNFAASNDVGLTIVGPEGPLVAGIRDFFDERGLRCFAPSQRAAQLEGSKAFSKEFLSRHEIPTSRYETFTSLADASRYIQAAGAPIVVKADGLAAGKGVVVAATVAEAVDAARVMLSGERFGDAGEEIVVEEFLAGEEASFIVVSDGDVALPFASSQDHKARDAGDTGPNTGGMGAYSPAPVVTEDIHQQIMENIINPTVQGMAADGIPYQGFLYAGLMIDKVGVARVIEFNCRFGDPEAQPVMMRLESDLVEVCQRALDTELSTVELAFAEDVALGVVLASGGYPDNYDTGHEIHGLAHEIDGTKLFHAGTREDGGRVITAGGRVLCAVGMGSSVGEAQARAYQRVDGIGWKDMYYRSDIGHRAVRRETR
ncbi:MAG: phosphoribosylamine--glycine ligase [Pseudomonadales bacterium]